jgi:hypothetical protein
MSQDAVQRAVEGTIAQFKDDVTASRNRLLTDMRVALSTRDVRLDFDKPRFENFQKAFDECVTSSVQGQGEKTVGRMVVVFVASGVAGVVAERLVGQIVGLLSAEAVSAGAEAAAASGSAMVSGGALGAASGWLGGPAGEIVGVGAGLAIGAGIDWWLSERFKTNLTQELTNYLDNLERDMIEGEAATTEQPARPGLRETLRRAAGELYDLQCKATQKALAKG